MKHKIIGFIGSVKLDQLLRKDSSRTMDPDDARYLRDQCRESGIRFHMKQMSGRTKAELTAIPEDLRIREFPEVTR